VREQDFGLHQESFSLKTLEGRIMYIEKKKRKAFFWSAEIREKSENNAASR